MESKNRKTFIMFLLAFLIASFIVSLVEVLRSSFIPVGPDVQTVSAVSSADNPRSPGSFADLAEKLKPSVVNISTTKTVRSGRGGPPRAHRRRAHRGGPATREAADTRRREDQGALRAQPSAP